MTPTLTDPQTAPDISTLGRVRALIRQQYDVPVEALRPDAALADFGLDSLSVAELIFSVEDYFGIDYPADRTDVRTLGELVSVVDAALAAEAKADADAGSEAGAAPARGVRPTTAEPA